VRCLFRQIAPYLDQECTSTFTKKVVIVFKKSMKSFLRLGVNTPDMTLHAIHPINVKEMADEINASARKKWNQYVWKED